MGISDRITCRRVLNLMVMTGFMFNYMLRVNFTIAIVAMVQPLVKNATNLVNTTLANGIVTLTNVTQNVSYASDSLMEDTRFDWDEGQQSMMLGAFYCGYILTELPGGRLAEIVGARRVFGYAMLITSILTLITPTVAKIDWLAVVALRAVIGFMLGATWPAMPPMAAAWIPPLERSSFIANMMASSLGAAITLPICGYLIATLGWGSVFYLTGLIGIGWSILWLILIFDTPAEHPRITEEEKHFIENSIAHSGGQSNKPDRVPWCAMLSSPAVWAIIITHGCSVFGYFAITNQLPTYMKYILNYNIKANGVLASLPYLGKYLFAVLTSFLADGIRTSGRLTTAQTRKAFTTFAVLTPGIFMILQVFFGHDKVWSVVIFTIALTCNGGVTAGYLSNGLDIAPNFAGTIMGLANTLSSAGGFISSWIIGILTYHNQTYGQWQIVFWMLSGTYFVGAMAFLFFGQGEIQPWNNGPPRQQPPIPIVQTNGNGNPEVIPLKEKI